MKTDFTEIGKRIVQRRTALNITQETLAERSDVSATFVGHIERATTKCSIETLMKLCDALKVTPDYLLIGVNKKIEDDILEEINSEILRCDKKKQNHILEYIRWFSNQKF